MTIAIHRPWTRQPQYGVGIDRSNPITRGLILASCPGLLPFNALNNTKLVVTTQTSATLNRFGVSLNQSAGSNAAYFPAVIPAINPNYTLLTIASNPSESRAVYALMIGDEVANGNSQIRLGLNINSAGAASAGEFALVEYGSKYNAQVGSSSGGTLVDGVPHIYAAVRNSNNAAIWRDGVKINSVTNAADFSTPAQVVYVSGTGISSGGALHHQTLALVWLRSLEDQEMLRIMANPWQVFRPRMIVLPGGAAAPTAPTLSALSAINVTSSSAQPRITYTF